MMGLILCTLIARQDSCSQWAIKAGADSKRSGPSFCRMRNSSQYLKILEQHFLKKQERCPGLELDSTAFFDARARDVCVLPPRLPYPTIGLEIFVARLTEASGSRRLPVWLATRQARSARSPLRMVCRQLICAASLLT